MSWVKTDLFSRTSSRTSSASTDTSSKNEYEDLNLTLYGSSVPLRRTRTIIHRAKTRTLRTLSLVPGVGGGAAKLLSEDTTLDLGFTLDDIDHEYNQMEESSSARTSSYCIQRQESDSSDIAESEQSETSHDISSVESSPDIPRSSTCASWTTDEYSIKSDNGSVQEPDQEPNGEWNNFWQKYNKTNIKEERKVPEKRSPQIQKVIMSTADAVEAASCARRLSEILSSAIRRSSLPGTKNDCSTTKMQIPKPPVLPDQVSRSKSESELPGALNINPTDLQDQKLKLKPLGDDCVEIEIQSTDPLSIAEILKKVLNQRRSDIMPPDDCSSGNQSHRSDWSNFE